MALQRREVRKGEMQRQPYIDKSTVRIDYAKMLVLGGLIPICGYVYYPPS